MMNPNATHIAIGLNRTDKKLVVMVFAKPLVVLAIEHNNTVGFEIRG
jgi:hypothetical protein